MKKRDELFDRTMRIIRRANAARRRRFWWSAICIAGMITAILILGLQFTDGKLESTSWIKVVAGCCVFWFSIYGLKIILKVK